MDFRHRKFESRPFLADVNSVADQLLLSLLLVTLLAAVTTLLVTHPHGMPVGLHHALHVPQPSYHHLGAPLIVNGRVGHLDDSSHDLRDFHCNILFAHDKLLNEKMSHDLSHQYC